MIDRGSITKRKAEISGEFRANGDGAVHGVMFDGRTVWAATGDRIRAFDPGTGQEQRSIEVPAHAGTAFDGQHLFQIAVDIIQKIDPDTGAIVATIPAPGGGRDSGLAWAGGSLWVGQYRDQKIIEIDPDTGNIRRSIKVNRFVTGVTWVEGELWHGYWTGQSGGIARINPASGKTLATMEMPDGIEVSGLESDGGDRFVCGGGESGVVRVLRRT
jgi:glutamine cyclotransferase